MKDYDFYLFDADGTLFDTADMILKCYQHVAQHYNGQTLDDKRIMAGYGLPLKGQLYELLGNHIDVEEVMDEYMNYQLEIIEESVKPFPGVVDTLETLKNNGKQLAIVTSRRRYSMERILGFTGTAHYFENVVTPEDSTRHKPDAEPALLAMKQLGATPETTIFTGDAEYDILSGNSAGTDTAFVDWSHVNSAELPVAPTWVLAHMTDLTAPFNQ